MSSLRRINQVEVNQVCFDANIYIYISKVNTLKYNITLAEINSIKMETVVSMRNLRTK